MNNIGGPWSIWMLLQVWKDTFLFLIVSLTSSCAFVLRIVNVPRFILYERAEPVTYQKISLSHLWNMANIVVIELKHNAKIKNIADISYLQGRKIHLHILWTNNINHIKMKNIEIFQVFSLVFFMNFSGHVNNRCIIIFIG
jgi:predicted phosphatase